MNEIEALDSFKGNYFAPFEARAEFGGFGIMRNLIVALIIAFLPFAFGAQSLAGYVEPYDMKLEAVSGIEGGTSFPVVFEGAGFVKIHLGETNLLEGDRITLLAGTKTGEAGKKVYEIFGPMEGEMWLPSVDGEAAFLSLDSKGGSGFSIDKVGIGLKDQEEAGHPERTCGNDDRVDPACAEDSYRMAGEKTGRILFEANGFFYYCSGFLAGEDGLFVTNRHCIFNSEVAESAEVRWKYEMTTCGGSSETYDSISIGGDLLMAEYRVDLALLKFAGDNPASRYGYLALDDRKLEKGETIWIPQHPMGGVKKFAIHSDSDGGATIISLGLTGAQSTTQAIGYNLDVEAGSSGSPVLDADNKVVALHSYVAEKDTCASPYLNKGIIMEILYPYIKPYLATCAGTPPSITQIKYNGKKRRFKLEGSGFMDDSVVLVNGVTQSTKLKKGKLVAAMFDKLLHGDTVTLSVFNPQTGCTSQEAFYTRP